MVSMIIPIYDRPSLRVRKKVGDIDVSKISQTLRRVWVKPPHRGPYVEQYRLLLEDGRTVYCDKSSWPQSTL